MSESMTREFTASFLTTCFAAGLSKEAASQLLQKESVDQVKTRRGPAWAAGYEKAASEIPGQLRPVLFGEGGLEKSAGVRLDLIRKALGGIRQAFGGALGLGGQAVRDAGKAIGKVVGPRNTNSFVSKHPFTSLVAGTAVGGLGALGVNRHINGDDLSSVAPPDPFYGPSGYNSGRAKDRRESRYNADYGPGIAEDNKNHFGSHGRRKELEKALADGAIAPGGAAYRELKELNRSHADSLKQRGAHYKQLDALDDYHRDKLERIKERTGDWEDSRTSIWGLPRRTWEKVWGRDPEDFYDDKISNLYDHAQASQLAVDLANDRRRGLYTGNTSGKLYNDTPTAPDLQNKFFPSYED